MGCEREDWGRADLEGRAPLKPFADVNEMVSKLSRLFHRMSTDLGKKFDMLVEMDTLDLDTRKAKRPEVTSITYRRAGYHSYS